MKNKIIDILSENIEQMSKEDIAAALEIPKKTDMGDFAQVMSNGVITLETARTALDRLEIDELGLDRNDRRMLEAIVRFYNGGPVGLETLAAAIGEEAVTIEDVYEPYLLQIGFVSRTPRGRCITAEACRHLGCEFPKGVVNAQPTQPTLFGDRES